MSKKKNPHTGLKPVIDENTRILILGALPDEISIKNNRYYADISDDFWKLMSNVVNKDLDEVGFVDKRKILLQKKIGLYFVYSSPLVTGSMDERIKAGKMNNFKEIIEKYPNIKLICFNGAKASQAKEDFLDLDIKLLSLPSSSGANRRYAEQRYELWASMR